MGAERVTGGVVIAFDFINQLPLDSPRDFYTIREQRALLQRNLGSRALAPETEGLDTVAAVAKALEFYYRTHLDGDYAAAESFGYEMDEMRLSLTYEQLQYAETIADKRIRAEQNRNRVN